MYFLQNIYEYVDFEFDITYIPVYFKGRTMKLNQKAVSPMLVARSFAFAKTPEIVCVSWYLDKTNCCRVLIQTHVILLYPICG